MNDDNDEVLCEECEEYFSISDFDNVDDEFNEDHPMCVECQKQARIRHQECDHCDEPATHEIGDLYLCDYHYEMYADGYRDD